MLLLKSKNLQCFLPTRTSVSPDKVWGQKKVQHLQESLALGTKAEVPPYKRETG